MEQTNNNYPKFEKGQVLTSQALNSYFGYLDEQQRLTRAKLLGVGIIDGLEYKLSENKLTIKKGSAVTADGYLIDLPEKTTYNLIYKKSNKMLANQSPLSETVDNVFDKVLKNVEYVFYKDEADTAKHNLSATASTSMPKNWETDYVLALMVDFDSQDTITKCNELSCDIVQGNYQVEIRPVLIKCTCFDNDYLTNLTTPGIEVSLDKITHDFDVDYDHLLESLNKIAEPIFMNPKRPLEYFMKTYDQLETSLSKDIQQVVNIFLHFKEHLFYDITTSDFANIQYLSSNMGMIVEQEYKSKSTRFSGYYLDFLFQLRTATREFLTTFYEFAWKYKPNNIKAYPRIVVIGFGEHHRQTRISHDNSYIDSLTILKKHLNRIVSMSKNFYFNKENYIKNTSSKELSIYYIKKESKLGERDIPGFINSEKRNYWYAHSYAESSLPSDKKLLDIYEQETRLSEYELIIDNYYGKPLKNLEKAITEIGEKSFFTHTDSVFKDVHYIHIDDSIPDFFSNNEAGGCLEKEHYLEDVLMAYKNSAILQQSPIFEDIINKITNGKPIDYSSDAISLLVSTIDNALQNEKKIWADTELSWTKDFLSQFCNVYKIASIGRCRYGGELYVFYSGNRDKIVSTSNGITSTSLSGGINTFITLIVGTY